MFSLSLLFAATASASILWDGRLNNYTSASFLSDWSWSNQVGPYQYYIHGSGDVSTYVALSQDYKNPFDDGSDQGIQLTIDNSSSWNGQTMLRTELIPQTSASINKNKVYYHFSLSYSSLNPPNEGEEHQICFFESHFTEMKYGVSGNSNALQWFVNSESQWNQTFEAGVWHNIAYGIDFDAGSVDFWHSTGSKDLELTVKAVDVSAESNGQDWHLGVLRLPAESGGDVTTEDWHFSGVYIEDGDLTKSISGPGDASSGSSNSSTSDDAASRIALSSTAAPTTLQTSVKSASTTSEESGSTSTSCSTDSATTTAFSSVNVAANPAPTFDATASITQTYTPSSVASWYSQATGSSPADASQTCEVVYATVTVTA